MYVRMCWCYAPNGLVRCSTWTTTGDVDGVGLRQLAKGGLDDDVGKVEGVGLGRAGAVAVAAGAGTVAGTVAVISSGLDS